MGRTSSETDGPAEMRRRRREVIRQHHPDAGGDAEVLIAELSRLDTSQAPSPDGTEIRFVRRDSRWRRARNQVRSAARHVPLLNRRRRR